jgi:methionyl-tRNA formyltransferase
VTGRRSAPGPGHTPGTGKSPDSAVAPSRGTARARTAFFGSGAFAVGILETLQGLPEVDLTTVVTVPDRPVGRSRAPVPTPVAQRAAELGLAVVKPSSLRTPNGTAAVAEASPDLAILADYGRLVPPGVLEIPRLGFLNLHPSLLPRHRGATPIAGAILAGDDTTGVTLFRMDAGLDTGPIVAQERWLLAPDATADDLVLVAATRAADLLAAALPRWLAGQLEPRPQDEAVATLTRPFGREDGRLDPGQPALLLERRVRALRPWPGTFVEAGGTRIAVTRSSVAPSGPSDVAGRLVGDEGGLALATVDGRLRLLEVRPAGGRSMSGSELRRGRPGLIGQPTSAGDRGSVAAVGSVR